MSDDESEEGSKTGKARDAQLDSDDDSEPETERALSEEGLNVNNRYNKNHA